MSTITFRVSEEEKQFIEQMANLHHVSLSELVKKNLLDSLEDQIDMILYDEAMAKHQIKDESISHDDMKRALGL